MLLSMSYIYDDRVGTFHYFTSDIIERSYDIIERSYVLELAFFDCIFIDITEKIDNLFFEVRNYS